VYIVEQKKKKKRHKKEKTKRTLLPRLALIVNVEDRRQSRNSDYGEEKENAIAFPQASEQEKSR
jgi:hypothetical protein